MSWMRGRKPHGEGEGGLVVVLYRVSDARILAETSISGCAEKVTTIGHGCATLADKPGRVAASTMGFAAVAACGGQHVGCS